MKIQDGKICRVILVTLMMLFISQAIFAKEVSLGTGLGLRTYQSEGSGYANSQVEADLFIDWENVGLKMFADFSFYSGVSSTLENLTVKYKTKSESTREEIGFASYYIFKNSEKLKIIGGPIIGFDFVQTKTGYNSSTKSNTYDVTTSSMNVNLGLFLGTKFHATKKLDIFFELPMTTQFARKYFSYKKDDTEIEHYQNEGVGFGGGISFRPYFTPKLGIAYKF